MTRRPTRSPVLRALQRLRAAFWRRRMAQGLIRAAWLALSVPTLLLAGHLALGWSVRWRLWGQLALGLGALATLWSLRPVSLTEMIRRLDARLGLRARLVTAFEVGQRDPAGDEDNPVVRGLLQETVGLAIRLRRRVRTLNLGLWLEVQTLVAVLITLVALLLLDALRPRLPSAAPLPLPPAWQEPAAEQVLPPDPALLPPPFQEPVAGQPADAGALRDDLQALAEALRDPALTRSIAEALDRGDLDAAAEGLRRLADQLDALSPEAQRALGEALDEAAEGVGQDAPGLQDPLQEGSAALQQGDLPAARQALEDLARALEEAAAAPPAVAETEEESGSAPAEPDQPQDGDRASGDAAGAGKGAGEGEGGQGPAEAERLGVEGQPLELESDPDAEERVLQPAEPGAGAGDETAPDSPFARQPANVSAGDLGPDPLSFPWDRRDVIRRYFTPRSGQTGG